VEKFAKVLRNKGIIKYWGKLVDNQGKNEEKYKKVVLFFVYWYNILKYIII